MRYLVKMNMGFCGADHDEVVEADNENEAYKMAEEVAQEMISIEVVDICQECDLPEEECDCLAEICDSCGEAQEDCECCQECGSYLCECEEQE